MKYTREAPKAIEHLKLEASPRQRWVSRHAQFRQVSKAEVGGPPLSLFLQAAKPTMFLSTLSKQNREAQHLTSSGIVRLLCSTSHCNTEFVRSGGPSLEASYNALRTPHLDCKNLVRKH